MRPDPILLERQPFFQRWKTSLLSRTRFTTTGTPHHWTNVSSATTPPTTHHLSHEWLPLIKDHPGMSLFHSAQTFADLLYLTRLYLTSQITSSLSCLSPVYKETNIIIDELLFLNSRGIVTVSSQPGIVEDTNNGETRGKGDATQRKQRAYLEGFCTLDVAHSIAAKAKSMHDAISPHILISIKPITPNPSVSTILELWSQQEDPFPVTQTYDTITADYIATTTVSFSNLLNEVEQFFLPQYPSPGEVAQIVLVSVVWGVGKEWWDLLKDVMDVGEFGIVNPFVAP